MHSVWWTITIMLHVNVQNVLLQKDVFVVAMEKHISMNVNYRKNLVQREPRLKCSMKENVVS